MIFTFSADDYLQPFFHLDSDHTFALLPVSETSLSSSFVSPRSFLVDVIEIIPIPLELFFFREIA